MLSYIYDQGACVARSLTDGYYAIYGKEIGTVRNGSIYGLNGEFVGHLQVGGMVRSEGDLTPDRFRRLLNK